MELSPVPLAPGVVELILEGFLKGGCAGAAFKRELNAAVCASGFSQPPVLGPALATSELLTDGRGTSLT
jgi:hypothetical protein